MTIIQTKNLRVTFGYKMSFEVVNNTISDSLGPSPSTNQGRIPYFNQGSITRGMARRIQEDLKDTPKQVEVKNYLI